MNIKQPQPSRRLLLEELEPRILFSADAAAGLIDPGHWAPNTEVRLLDTATAVPGFNPIQLPDGGQVLNATRVGPGESIQQSREIAFVDAGVEGYQSLIDDLQQQKDAGRSIDIYLINKTQNGAQEIGSILSNYQGLSAVHILSHGADGILELGDTALDNRYVVSHAGEIARWGDALSGDGDLLLYGCDFAASSDGQALINQLGRVTGADVAASMDLTGAASKGGNWNLEYQTGSIEAATAIDIAGQNLWQGTLANSAPVLDATKSPALSSNYEDAGAPSGAVGSLVSTLVDSAFPLSNVTDVDVGAVRGIAVTAADTTNGTWYYSTNNGSTWTALGAVSDTSAQLLASDAVTRLYFQPNTNYSGTLASAITFRAWDQTSGSNGSLADTSTNGGATAFSTATDTASIIITAINDAPTLGNGSLAAIQEDASNPPGQTVAAIFAGQFADVDAGASFSGIAVVANDANATTQGAWQYSTNGGGNWADIGMVGDGSAALALNTTTLIRFVPAADYNGNPTALILRGMDNTYAGGFSSTAGAEMRITVDTSTKGGTTAIAAAASTLSITVNPANDAPVLAGAVNLSSIAEDPVSNPGTLVSALISGKVTDADAGALSGIAVTAVNNTNGIWQYSRDGGTTWTGFVSATDATATLLAADANTLVRFVPNANWNGSTGITFRAWDQTSGTAGGTADASVNGGATAFSSASASSAITVAPVNDAPVMVQVTLTLSSGDTIFLSPANINAMDIDSPTINFSYSVSNVTNGYFELVTAPAVPVSTFSYVDLNANRVRFVSPAYAPAPSFTVTVSDGALTSPPMTAQIDFTQIPFWVLPGQNAGSVSGSSTPTSSVGDAVASQSTADSQLSHTDSTEVLAPRSGMPNSNASGLPTDQDVYIQLQQSQQSQKQLAAYASQSNSVNPGHSASIGFWLEDEKVELNAQLASMNIAAHAAERQAGQPALSAAVIDQGQDKNTLVNEIKAHAAQISGISLTTGFAWWALRAGGLLAGLLASLPVWRQVDPMLILDDKGEGRDEEDVAETEADLEAASMENGLEEIFGNSERNVRE